MAFERPDECSGASVRGATESPPRFGENDEVTATGESAISAVQVRGSNLRPTVAGDVADGGTRAVFSAIKRSNIAISRRKQIVHAGQARQRRVRVRIHFRDRMSVRDQSVFRPGSTTTGVVDAVAALLGRSSIHRLVGDSFGADHDGRGRRRRSASWPHVGRQLL